MIWVLLQSESPWQCNDAVAFFIYLCVSLYQEKAKRNKFASKKTLDYFQKKYLEYANNWLVSEIAVRAETVNVTAHLVRCNN